MFDGLDIEKWDMHKKSDLKESIKRSTYVFG
jgi:hypothetical protein